MPANIKKPLTDKKTSKNAKKDDVTASWWFPGLGILFLLFLLLPLFFGWGNENS